MWAEVDNMLAEEVAYIPLDISQFYYLRGSNIENYVPRHLDERLPGPRDHLRQGRRRLGHR